MLSSVLKLCISLNKTSLVVVWSSANFFLLKLGQLPPYFFEIFAIFSLSVDMSTLVKIFAFFAAIIEYPIRGLPKKFTIFFLDFS